MTDSILMLSVIKPQKSDDVKYDIAASSLGLDSYSLTPCAPCDASSRGDEHRERVGALLTRPNLCQTLHLFSSASRPSNRQWLRSGAEARRDAAARRTVTSLDQQRQLPRCRLLPSVGARPAETVFRGSQVGSYSEDHENTRAAPFRDRDAIGRSVWLIPLQSLRGPGASAPAARSRPPQLP